MENTIRIYSNQKDGLKDFLTGVFVMICGVVALIYPGIFYDENKIWRNFDYNFIVTFLSGLITIGAALLLLANGYNKLIKNRDLAVINQNGILNNSNVLKLNHFIKWHNIVSIKFEIMSIRGAYVRRMVVSIDNGKCAYVIIPKKQYEHIKQSVPIRFSEQISENNIILEV